MCSLRALSSLAGAKYRMATTNPQLALEEDLRLGLTPEFLLEEYIHKDRSLQDIADQFSVGVKKVRGALKRARIQKSTEQIRAKFGRLSAERSARGENNFRHMTLEQHQANQLKGVQARLANKIQKLQEAGLTESYLRQLYITENLSLKELCEKLGLSRGELRNLLKFYGIIKTQEDRDRARNANLGLFYEDPEKVLAMTLKRHETVQELYGNSWYRKTTSREEDTLRDAIREQHPDIELIQSDWSTIRRASNKAQLQLDLLIPELKVAIEYNGEYYHDRERYEASLRGECESPELEKSLLCEDAGFRLIHVWSSDWISDPASVLASIASVIESRA